MWKYESPPDVGVNSEASPTPVLICHAPTAPCICTSKPCLLFTGVPSCTMGDSKGARTVAPIPATLGNTSRTDEFKKFPVTFTNSGAILYARSDNGTLAWGVGRMSRNTAPPCCHSMSKPSLYFPQPPSSKTTCSFQTAFVSRVWRWYTLAPPFNVSMTA